MSCTAFPPVHVAVQAGVVPLLVDCLAFGASDDQVNLSIYSKDTFPDLFVYLSIQLELLVKNVSCPLLSTSFKTVLSVEFWVINPFLV